MREVTGETWMSGCQPGWRASASCSSPARHRLAAQPARGQLVQADAIAGPRAAGQDLVQGGPAQVGRPAVLEQEGARAAAGLDPLAASWRRGRRWAP